MDMKNLVIGCGFAGASIARKLAEAGEQAEIIERRAHIGGNAYDAPDAYGILIHVYGPHIFHTNDEEVYRFLSQFTARRPYVHRVAASVHRKLLPAPFCPQRMRGRQNRAWIFLWAGCSCVWLHFLLLLLLFSYNFYAL